MTLNFVAHTSAIVVVIIQMFDISCEVESVLQWCLICNQAFNFLHDVGVMVFERLIKKSDEGCGRLCGFVLLIISFKLDMEVFVERGASRP